MRGSMHEKLYDACPGERRNRCRQMGRRPSVLGELSKAQIRQRRPDSHSAPGSVPLRRVGVTTLFCVGPAAVPGYRGAVPGGYCGGRVDIVVPVRYTGIVSTHRMTAVQHGDLDEWARNGQADRSTAVSSLAPAVPM